LLAVIVGSLEMIHGALQNQHEFPRAKILRLLKTAETATERGAKLTRQLLAFARRGTLRPEIVVLDEVIVACEPFLRRALGEAITFRLSFEPGLWPCRIDPVQFEAAVLNLVVNARDAMPDGGNLEIATGNVTVEAATARRTVGLSAGDYVCIRISDTGLGMDAAVATRAFEPFFTTKAVGKGTGLGLSQVYGFVKQSEGHVTVDSKLGRGTTFTLYLPRCEEIAVTQDAQPDRVEPAPTGTETVLVVEDNTEVRELATAAISDLGYRVLAAANGPAALDILQHESRIDLLFSDVVLPDGMNGFELVRKACSMRDGLRALMTSGYANIHRPGTDRPDVPLLLKPYRRDQLAERIRMALDRP
jgi:CheY-like chemotaxis protein